MSTSLTAYLELLESLRDDLAANLSGLGVTASASETLQTLIPKVLSIPQGNPYVAYFKATRKVSHITNGAYQEFLFGQNVSFANIFQFAGYYMLSSCKVTLTGSGITAMIITAPGWTINKASDKSATLTANTASIKSGSAMQSLFNVISVKSNSEAHITITFTAYEQTTNKSYNISGGVTFDIQKNSWARVEDTYPTFAKLNKATWKQVESLVKV